MKILFTKTSEKQLLKLSLRFQEKVFETIKKFEKGERVDFKKLKGSSEEYRIRVGGYRIILSKKESNLFLVTDLGKRENIYSIFI
ncbi:MAG: cytotoxic translational repressor of toxin-antitoxin stability system [Nanoarchaeota archaeon]|nr:cytotoxic translational repressor of toxin-antitoxin stability system [Nanoarchaeota archaeon]